MEKLLDRDAVAEATGLSVPSIYRLMAKGVMPRPPENRVAQGDVV